jgi:hypothetical protein
MARPSVYIETTVISYLCALPSRDLIVAAHQQLTREWWDQAVPKLDCNVDQGLGRNCQWRNVHPRSLFIVPGWSRTS